MGRQMIGGVLRRFFGGARLSLGPVLVGGLFGAIGCSGISAGQGEDESVGTQKAGLTTGQRCYDGGSGLRAVGVLDAPTSQCTAVRIGRGVFLSARHCFQGNDDTAAGVRFTGSAGEVVAIVGNASINPYLVPNPLSSDSFYASKARDLELFFGAEPEGRPVAALPDAPGNVDLSELTAVGLGAYWNGSSCVDVAACHFAEIAGPSGPGGDAPTVRLDGSMWNPGDSGGPLFLGAVGAAPPVVVGVLSTAQGYGSTPGCDPQYPSHPPTSGRYFFTSLLWSGGYLIDEAPNVQAPLDWIRDELQARDPDGDGVMAPVDNCPEGNRSQADHDGDGIGDPCDPCPYDPNPIEAADPDDDEICNINSPDGSGDNCPNVANPEQANANLEVELVNGAVPVGDACEPVPSPVFEPRMRLQSESCHGSDAFEYSVCESRYGLSSTGPNLTFEPRGSFTYMPDPPITDAAASGDEHVVAVERTDLRYCAHHPTLANCFAPGAINEDLLQIAFSDENLETLFHRVQVDDFPLAVSSIGSSDYATWEPAQNLSWDWVSDFDRWQASAWGTGWVPDPQPSLDTLALDRGRFWMHAVTDVGMKNATAAWKDVTGVHPSQTDPAGAEKLANHYESVFPTQDRVVFDYHKVLYDEGVDLWARPCLTCGRASLESLLDHLSDPIDEHAWYDSLQSRPMTTLGDGKVVVVIPDGRAVPVSDQRVPVQVRQLLFGDDVVVPYAEANPRMGLGQQGAEYVILAADGTDIVDRIFTNGMRFTNGARLTDDMVDSSQDLGMETSISSDTSAPSPRTDFTAVYSRSSGRLFVVGGKEQATGELAGEIWQRGTNAGDTWLRLPSQGFTPGKVLAATYSYRDRSLWILDEVRVGHHLALGRLTRVNAGTGEADVVKTWPRLKLFDKHWMMLDRDGSVLLFASSSHTRAHWVFKLDPEEGALVGMRRNKGMLAGRPSVDTEGYSFLWQRKASDRPTVVRTSGLDLVPAWWHNLGGCL